jgi:hypothetical protein
MEIEKQRTANIGFASCGLMNMLLALVFQLSNKSLTKLIVHYYPHERKAPAVSGYFCGDFIS